MLQKQLLTIGLFSLVACSQANTAVEGKPLANTDNSKPLIIYLSRTQNTQTLAQIVQQQTNGDLSEIITQTPYPSDYKQTVEQVRRENEQGYLPPLKPLAHNVADYQVIYLGFPTWGMQLPPPVKSWLASTDLQGKIVYPFNSNGGYGVGSAFDDVKRLCRSCIVKEGFSIKGGSERDGVFLAIKGEKTTEAMNKISVWINKNR